MCSLTVEYVLLQVSKTEWMVWLELSPIQKHIYRQFLESDRVKDALASSRSPLVALTVPLTIECVLLL